MLAILGAVAEFENDIRRERQRDGIEKAKERGAYKGRPATIDSWEVARLASVGHGPTAIARRLGILRATVYRVAG
jgi:DNA invertase Pin-like site-specific DNA recombinase